MKKADTFSNNEDTFNDDPLVNERDRDICGYMDSGTINSIESRDINVRSREIGFFEVDYSKLREYYSMYRNMVKNTKRPNPQLIKRYFDDYMRLVESILFKGIAFSFCDYYYYNIARLCARGPKKCDKRVENVLRVLGVEFYLFFKVLEMVWLGDTIEKEYIAAFTPCRTLLLYSLIKRKFGEHLTFK